MHLMKAEHLESILLQAQTINLRFGLVFFFLSVIASNLRRFVSLKTDSSQLKATEQPPTFWSWQACLYKLCTHSCSRMELLPTVAPSLSSLPMKHTSSFIAKSFDVKWGFGYYSILSLQQLATEMPFSKNFFNLLPLPAVACNIWHCLPDDSHLPYPLMHRSRLKNVHANKWPRPDYAKS